MKIVSSGIVNGKILDKYGKRGKEKRFGMPTLSLPLEILNAPKSTKSFAIIFDDPEAVQGYFCHWLVANLERNKLQENESLTSYDFVQGKNGWNENCYGGPSPPDRPHKYRLRVFALKSLLPLRGDFSLVQLEKAMQNQVLETAVLYGIYEN